jgi:hypothetical protein
MPNQKILGNGAETFQKRKKKLFLTLKNQSNKSEQSAHSEKGENLVSEFASI